MRFFKKKKAVKYWFFNKNHHLTRSFWSNEITIPFHLTR